MDFTRENFKVLLNEGVYENFQSWLELDCDYQPRSIESHCGFVRLLMRFLGEKEYALESARSFLKYLKEKKYKINTRSSAAASLRIFTRFLASRYGITDFSREIPHIKKEQILIEILTNDEITRILTVPRDFRKHHMQQFWFLLLSLLARTGRRVNEIAQLKVSSLDFERSAMAIKKPKNKHPQWIPIPSDLSDLLKEFCTMRKTEYVFGMIRKGKEYPISPTGIRNELYIRQKILGIEKRPNPHRFRHSFPVELFRKKIPLPLVSELLGHENWETTKIYTHLLLDDLRTAANSHALNQENSNPHETISQFMENIKQFNFQEDKRFNYIKVKQAIDEFTTKLYKSIVVTT